jgi:DNA primase
VNRKALDELKQQIPLLDYLQAHDWRPARRIRDERQMGLCPLHTDHKPSFLVDPRKNLFYCYGCSRGGDVIRFVELYHQVKFSEAVALLREWCGLAPLLDQVIDFYRIQLFRHRDAVSYLTIADCTARMSSSTCESATHQAAVYGRGSPIWVIRHRCCDKPVW